MNARELSQIQDTDKPHTPMDNELAIDYTLPDIIRARANAYALLLRWAAERDAQAEQLQNHETAHQDGANHDKGTLDMSDILQTNQIQDPASASTETGQR